MQIEQYREVLDLVRRELASRNYRHAGELLESIAEYGNRDPEFFSLLAMLNEAEGRPMAAKQFYRHLAVGAPRCPTAFDNPTQTDRQEIR